MTNSIHGAQYLFQELDQRFRKQIHQFLVGGKNFDRNNPSPEFVKAMEQQKELDRRNLKRLAEIVEEIGWPSLKSVGTKATTAAFLIVQHADLDVQLKYLPSLRKAAAQGELARSELAMLEDRVLMRQGKLRVYGTQLHSDPLTGRIQLYPIEDQAHVDVRRAEVGLPPME